MLPSHLMPSCCSWVTLSVSMPGGFRILLDQLSPGPRLTNLHKVLPPSLSFCMSKGVGTAVPTVRPAIHDPTVIVPTRVEPCHITPYLKECFRLRNVRNKQKDIPECLKVPEISDTW